MASLRVRQLHNGFFIFKNRYGRTIVFPKELSFVHDPIITQSIPEAESLGNSDAEFYDSTVPILINKGFDVSVAEIPNIYLKKILAQVRDRALEFINGVLKKASGVKRTGINQDKMGIIFYQQTEDARLVSFQIRKQITSVCIVEDSGKLRKD